jgi:hypothetical protein
MPAVENGNWYRQEEVGQKVQTPKFCPGTPQQKQDGNDRSKVNNLAGTAKMSWGWYVGQALLRVARSQAMPRGATDGGYIRQLFSIFLHQPCLKGSGRGGSGGWRPPNSVRWIIDGLLVEHCRSEAVCLQPLDFTEYCKPNKFVICVAARVAWAVGRASSTTLPFAIGFALLTAPLVWQESFAERAFQELFFTPSYIRKTRVFELVTPELCTLAMFAGGLGG